MNAPMLRYSGDTRCQTACQADQNEFNGRSAIIFGCEKLRMIQIVGIFFVVGLFFAEAEVFFNFGCAVGAIFPFGSRSPLKLCCSWCVG